MWPTGRYVIPAVPGKRLCKEKQARLVRHWSVNEMVAFKMLTRIRR